MYDAGLAYRLEITLQTGGISETPKELLRLPIAVNMYGDGAHMVAYPINTHQTSWA